MRSFRDKETHLGSTYYQLQECSFFIHLLNLLIRSLGALSRHVVVAATAGPRACILFLVCGATVFFCAEYQLRATDFWGSLASDTINV